MRTLSNRQLSRPVAAASLVLGPLLMSVGDLLHPEERLDTTDQARIIVEHAGRWYTAHLLLFIGMLVFIPGVLALTRLGAADRPRLTYVGRILLIAGISTLAAVFMVEMLAGRFASDGAGTQAVAGLLDAFQSGAIFAVVGVGAVGFFGAVGLLMVPFIRDGGRRRWAASIFVAGAILIAIEIVSAEVVFSQVGNIALLVASAMFAMEIMSTGPDPVAAEQAMPA
jgi:hypothetical protein